MREDTIVLIADNDRLFARTAATALRRKGYEVIESKSAREALAIAQIGKPDLIVLDFMIPAMVGLEVARELISSPKTRDIPIILLSAANNRRIESISIAKDHWWAARMEKPVRLDELVATVDRLTQNTGIHGSANAEDSPLATDEGLGSKCREAELARAFLTRTRRRMSDLEKTLETGATGVASAKAPEHTNGTDCPQHLKHVDKLGDSQIVSGYSRIGEIAADAGATLTACIDEDRVPVGEELEGLRRAIMSIETQLANCTPAVDPPPRQRSQRAKAVLLLHDDPEYALEASRTARFHGLCINTVGDPELALRQVRKRRFAAIAMAGRMVADDSYALVQSFRMLAADTPIAVIVDAGTTEHMAAASAGADRIVPEHLDGGELAMVCNELTSASPSDCGRVLYIDASSTRRDATETALRQAGCQAISIPHSECLLETLDLVRPDLLMLSIDGQADDRANLVSVVRSSHHWHTLPIVAVSESQEDTNTAEILASDIDDLLIAPVIDTQGAARVAARLRRERYKRQRMDGDPVTEVSRREVFVGEAGRVIASLRSGATPSPLFATVCVDINRIVEHQGQRAADVIRRDVARRLMAEFNGARDLVGSLDGNYFGIMQREPSDMAIGERVSRCLEGIESVAWEATPTALPGVVRDHIGAAPDRGPNMLADIVADAIRAIAAPNRDGSDHNARILKRAPEVPLHVRTQRS